MQNLPCQNHQCPSTFIKWEVSSKKPELGCPDCYLEEKNFEKSNKIKLIHINKALTKPEYLITQLIQSQRVSNFFSKIFPFHDDDYLKNVKNLQNQIKELIDYLADLNNTLTQYSDTLVAYKKKITSDFLQIIDYEGFKKLCTENNSKFDDYFNKNFDILFQSIIKKEEKFSEDLRIDSSSPKIINLKQKFDLVQKSFQQVHQQLTPDFDSFFLPIPQSLSVPDTFLSEIIAIAQQKIQPKVVRAIEKFTYISTDQQSQIQFGASLRNILWDKEKNVQKKEFDFILLVKALYPNNIYGGYYSSLQEKDFVFSMTKGVIQQSNSKRDKSGNFLQHKQFTLTHGLSFPDLNGFGFQNSQKNSLVDHDFSEPDEIVQEMDLFELILD